MVRLTNHDRLECHAPEVRRPSHPMDDQLDDLAERMIKRQRGYKEGGVSPSDPSLERLRIQLRCERDVARFLMVNYDPRVEHHSQRSRLTTRHHVPVEVLVRERKTDPKGRHSMPELLIPADWPLVPGLACAFAVWCGDGCAPYLAGWRWEDEIRQGPAILIGTRPFHRMPVSQLHAMSRLVVASPYVPAKQINLEHAR